MLRHNSIPIVMGARAEEYEASAPYHSYIHVEDFKGPKHLAEYLHELDNNEDKYNAYFKWKVKNLINFPCWRANSWIIGDSQ